MYLPQSVSVTWYVQSTLGKLREFAKAGRGSVNHKEFGARLNAVDPLNLAHKYYVSRSIA